MLKYISAGFSRAQEFLHAKYGRRPLVKAAIWVAVALAGIFLGSYIEGLWPYVRDSINQFLALPIGFYGLVIIGVILWLILLAFLDTSPTVAAVKEWRARRKQAKPRPLTWEEQQIILPLRNLWNLQGKASTNSLRELCRYLQNIWKFSDKYGRLLNYPLDELEEGTKRMNEAVADDSPSKAEEIHERFNGLYGGGYRAVVFWAAQMFENEDLQADDKQHKRLMEQWVEAHKSFYDEMKRVNEIREHRGQLKFGGRFLDEIAGRFLRRLGIEL